MNCCVIIPAYEPEEAFVPYVQALLSHPGTAVVAVDDGSGPGYAPVFATLEGLEGCTVLRHPVNRGKGAALKTAFAWYLDQGWPDCPGVVTADCDGQHRIQDVLAVQARLAQGEAALILGSRSFGPGTPARSLSGNKAARAALAALYDIRLGDTQTGLRGIPNALLPDLCRVQGDRFEFELSMLVHVRQKCVPIVELPIHTLYFDNNRGTHFRAVADSLRILLVLCGGLLQYAGAAALSVALDVGTYALLVKALLIHLPLPGRIFFSTIAARVLSSTVNYACNRRLPYVQNRRVLPTLLKYYTLWFFQLLASFGGAWLLTGLGVDDLLGKLLVDLLLAALSYQVQMRWVFKAVGKEAARCKQSSAPMQG